MVRFGRDKLKVLKELDPLSLDIMVPSMMLQPLVENSIKHGLSPKIEGGAIVLKSRVRHKRLIIEVEDDGVGMADGILEKPTGMGGTGIGMVNVAERLQVLYGDDARMIISNQPERRYSGSVANPVAVRRSGSGLRGSTSRSALQHLAVKLLVDAE